MKMLAEHISAMRLGRCIARVQTACYPVAIHIHLRQSVIARSDIQNKHKASVILSSVTLLGNLRQAMSHLGR